jgi:hypothetical protein
MGLHGAAGLRVLDAERMRDARRVETRQARRRRHRAEPTRGGGPEETQRLRRSDAKIARHVAAHRHRHDQVAARHVATAFRHGQRRRQQCRHRVQHGGLADAVEFLAVDLEAVQKHRRSRRQPAASSPYRDVGRVAPPVGRAAQFGGARRRRSADAHAERIQDEHLRAGNRLGRQVVVDNAGDVRRQPFRQRRGLIRHRYDLLPRGIASSSCFV